MSSFASEYPRYDRMQAAFEDAIHAAVDLRPGARVLDVGCGAGTTTMAMAKITGAALGVDTDLATVTKARQRAEEAGSAARFECADAATHPFGEVPFDVLVSRFGMHLFPDPPAAFAHLRDALEGQAVFTTWRAPEHNAWVTVPARALEQVGFGDGRGASAPFGLADGRHLQSLLVDTGFRSVVLERVDAPLWVGDTLADAIDFFFATHGLGLVGTPAERPVASALESALTPHITDEGVFLAGSAWLVSAST